MQADARSLLLGVGSYGPKLLNLPGRKRDSTRRESIVTRSIEFPGGEKRQCPLLASDTSSGTAMAGEYDSIGSDGSKAPNLTTAGTGTVPHAGAHRIPQQGGSPRTQPANGAPATIPGLKNSSYASVASGTPAVPDNTATGPGGQQQTTVTDAKELLEEAKRQAEEERVKQRMEQEAEEAKESSPQHNGGSQPRPAKRPTLPKPKQTGTPETNPYSVLNGLPEEDDQTSSPRSSTPATDVLFDLNITRGEPSAGETHDNSQDGLSAGNGNTEGASVSSSIGSEQGEDTQVLIEDVDSDSMEEENTANMDTEQMSKDAEQVTSPISGRLWHGEAGNTQAPEATAQVSQSVSYLNTSTALSAQKQIGKK
ncbi:hypothetical protein R1sor_017388 [Riccia sorocarpa]|uniref:Uncharacterized protein n=1 Tax=Riccia sorocarpa TaxID=122646 RepID=A0ABD3I729_9MARC